MDLRDFGHFDFEHRGRKRTVYTCGDEGPGVILCHEIAGLSRPCMKLAQRIQARDFRVFAPVLFGTAGQGSMLKGFGEVCLSREFTKMCLGKSSSVSAWLCALSARVEKETGVAGVAAIGMCVTGGIVIPLLLADPVRAVVAAQPSLPFAAPFSSRRRRSDLGMSDVELACARQAGKQVFPLRFERDPICPKARVARVRAELPGPPLPTIPSRRLMDHAVLTHARAGEPDDPTDHVFEQVIEFLNDNLRNGRTSGTGPPRRDPC